jgi:lipopolysaccharide transport system permease protein
MTTTAADAPTTLIRPPRRFAAFAFRELWKERELVFYLALRSVKVRYKQTALGGAWAVLQPLVTMVVFTIVLKRFAGGKIATGGVPYPVLSYSALIVWYFFANAVTGSSMSLVSNSSMLQKIYFPRLALPISSVLAVLVDFVASGSVLVALMVYYGVSPNGWAVLLLPVFLLIAFCAALGVGMWLSAVYVRFRDVQYALPFALQIALLLTPIVYPLEFMTAHLSPVGEIAYELNPMVGVSEGFRWALTGHGTMTPQVGLLAALGAAILLVVGFLYFKRTEVRFADIA